MSSHVVHMFSLLMIFFGIMTFKQSTASEPCVTVAGTTAPWETLSCSVEDGRLFGETQSIVGVNGIPPVASFQDRGLATTVI